MAAKLSFDLIGNAQSAVAAFAKTTDASKKAAGSAESTTSSFKKIAGAIATGYAVTKVVDFAKESVSTASAVKVANKELVGVFANAGDATGKWGKHAIELADSLGRQIGVSPQVIKGAEGILATFQNVSSAAALQGGVFDRATKAAADLAAAGFGDLSGNAKLLGKALNDPTKYMGSLGRAGVSLTKTQIDQIKAMQGQGNLLGAQKTLLGDVESRVGGLAATTATAGAKTGVAYEEMKAQLGTALLPAVKEAQLVMAGFFTFVSQNSGWLIPLAAAIMGVVAAIKIWTTVTALLDAVSDANPWVLLALALVALVGVIVYLATKTQFFQDIWRAMTGAVMAAWNVVWGLLQAAFRWVANNWPLLVGILGGPFGIAVAYIITHWQQVMGLLGGVVSAVARFFSGVFGAIISPFQAAINWFGGVPGAMGRIMSGAVGAVASAVSGVFQAVIYPFTLAWAWVQDHILGPLKSAWNGFAHVINSVSISTPGVKIAGHEIIPAFHWTPPWRIPTLDQGGFMTRSGLVYAHAGEVISPAPANLTAAGATRNVAVHMTVNVPETANPAETGRAVAGALRSFFAAGGRLDVPA